MIRILLVDDHPVVRYGIRQILVDGFRAVHIGEAQDVATGLESVRSDTWDVVVLDMTLPDGSGLDLLKEIRVEQPALPVLVLSMHPGAQFAWRAIAAGASAYLTKDSAPTELVQAIEQVRRERHRGRGAAPVPPRGAKRGTVAHDALSDREYQVLRMIGSGRTVSEIAEALALSVKTVSTYRTRVLEKLRMRTNAEMMRYVIENRLTDT
jgi:two-component system invasion response regulator UvrY